MRRLVFVLVVGVAIGALPKSGRFSAGAWGGTCATRTAITIAWPSNNSKHAFNTDNPGVKSILCVADATPDCPTPRCASPRASWSAQNIGYGTVKSWNPDPPKGSPVTLTYTTLPTSNSGFGSKWVTISVDSVSDTHTFKLFFTATATNHPDPYQGQMPNWMYYWTQALSASPLYYNAGVDYGKIGGSAGNFIVIIGENAYVTDDSLPRHAGVKWIDAFGYIVSHERQGHLPWVQHDWSVHGVDIVNGGMLPVAVDVDRDGVCDREPGDPHPPSWHGGGWEAANGTSPIDPTTNEEGNPPVGIPDHEWIARQHETNPNAGSLDWAFQGSQWPQ